MTRYLIIGTGVAAIAAAEAIRTQDPGASLIIIGDDPHRYYSRPGLAYYLSGEVNEKMLFPYQVDEDKRLNAQYTHAAVTRILPEEQAVEIQPGGRIPFDRLLIATGASAVPLSVPGSDLQGVVKLDHMEDALRILAHVRRTRSAVVVGGGITALELAEGLAARHIKVHYLLRGQRYWSNVLDETESRIIEKRLENEGILIHYQADLAAIEGKQGAIAGVRLTSGEQIGCEMLAYAIGITPRKALAEAAGIVCDRGILVDPMMETSRPGIFAAGDAAQVLDLASGKYLLDSLWPAAREQGRAAGLNMAGQKEAFRKPVAFNVTRLSGLTTTIIGAVGGGRDADLVGIARGDSETWRENPDAMVAQSRFDVNRLRLMIGKTSILGAVVMGDQKLSVPLQVLVRDKVDITSIRDQLLDPQAPFTDILLDFWHRQQSALKDLHHAA
jgi:nitrite reductase (NADH) large subunit